MGDCFHFRFCYANKCFVLKVYADEILLNHAYFRELSRRLIQHHKIPGKYFQELCDQLQDFLKLQIIKLQNEEYDKSLVEPSDPESFKNLWSELFKQGHLKFSKLELISNETIFSDVYHSLIHSKFIDYLLELEHSYSLAISTLLTKRDESIAKVEEQCQREMETALQNIGIKYNDHQVNQLAKKQIETSEMEASRWTSEICNLKEKQKRQFVDQVMKLYERLEIEHTSGSDSLKPADQSETFSRPLNDINSVGLTRREESFTVHLGAQMKMSHNLRLISCDVLDLCRVEVAEMTSGPHVHATISLYSNNLCGLVLLVDNRLNSFSGIKKEFARVCDQCTDFHFPTLEQQMDKIAASLKEAESAKANRMNTGDFYITKHSNLSEVHVIFHLVVDDSLQNDISSRHPVMVAFRNVIKTAFQNDITTLTLPLFLVHEMTEEMTIPWCLKRAELVFKCIKGFIMELPHCSFNIQFLVPQTLSNETFSSLSTMMPSIFRMSNPVIARS